MLAHFEVGEDFLFSSPFSNAPAFDWVLDGGNERPWWFAWNP
jgi:hypothetical protein